VLVAGGDSDATVAAAGPLMLLPQHTYAVLLLYKHTQGRRSGNRCFDEAAYRRH